MSRKNTNFLDYGIEEDIDPKIKFNSLLSVTVSTVMCLAAKCPLPKSNIETTKLFLSTITDDNGQGPRNMKGLLTLLDNYQGPYDSVKEKLVEKPSLEKTPKEKKESRVPSSDSMVSKGSETLSTNRENVSLTQPGDGAMKRIHKPGTKKNEKETPKKTSKIMASKILASKSVLSAKSSV